MNSEKSKTQSIVRIAPSQIYKRWTELLAQVPKEEQATWIRESLREKTAVNVYIFGKYFFPHIIKGDTPLSHLELIGFLVSPKDGAAIYPRGFAKTTWEKIDTLHDIVYTHEPVILYISATLQDAGFHFESIKAELENNDTLREVYGNLVPDLSMPSVKWTNKHFETTNGVNLVARGAGKGRGVNIKNRRPTKIIIDDAETDEQVNSLDRRKKYSRWLNETIIPSKDKEKGRVKIIGTVIHPECEVLKFYKGHGGIFKRAIESGQSIWPQYWPIADLFKLRDGFVDESGERHEGIGTRAFMQEYMNEPINDDTSIFKQEWLDRNTWESLPPLSTLTIKMAVDPNAGESQMADFMGIVVMARDPRSKLRYVLHAEKIKKSIDKELDDFDAIYTKWNPQLAGIEAVLNMTAFYQLAASKKKYRLRKIDPKGKDKVNRAKMVEPLVEQGIIKFCPTHVELYNELIQFPNGAHDDLVDAFIYCNSLFDQDNVKLKTNRSSMITASLQKAKF